jgi:hypothetical protein|nr:MAG TPA: Sporulation initiation factor Spo0A C terminal [Caudoviricetes sp.]
MDKDFKKRLTKGTLLFVIKKHPKKELVVELLEDVGIPASYCSVRYLYRNGAHVSLEGAMLGVCFYPEYAKAYDTYIITEKY